jgi:glycosyltransferase involved in cell wall biosynthesis
MKQNVLFILHNLIIGGVEKCCYEIVKNIDRKRYQIDFLIAPYANSEQYYEPLMKEYGCNVFHAPTVIGKRGKKAFLKRLGQILSEKQYDVVHSHVDFLNTWTLKEAKKHRVPIRVSHVHAFPNDSIRLPKKLKHLCQQKLLCRYATDRLGCSALACEWHYGAQSKYTVFHNGFDTQPFLELPSERPAKNLITVGRMAPEKNPMFTIEVVKELVLLDPEYHLTYVGGGVLFDCVQKAVASLGIEANVDLVGKQPNLLPYFKNASVAIFPSLHEGLGIAIVEAQLAHCFSFFSSVCPKEADVGLSMQLDLELGAKGWAKAIDDFVTKKANQKDALDAQKVALYDMKEEVKKLEAIYERKT